MQSLNRKMMRHSPAAVVALMWTLSSMPLFGAKAPKSETSGDELFTQTVIRHLRIEIAETNLDVLRTYQWRRDASPEERPEVICTVREGDSVFTNVAVHLKGSAGSYRSVDSKPAFTLNFDKQVEGQTFHGLEKISLNNSVQDPTFISEKLSRELYARAGVPVPRADYATVELNGRRLGLYVLLEGWNKQFLKRHFKNTKGNLYDPPLLADLDQQLEVATGNFPNDQSELAAVVSAARESDRAKRFARMDSLVDLDRFSRLIALDLMLWNYDGYVLHSNNYRVFHDIDSGRIVFMPHGLDQMFRNPNGPLLASGDGLAARAYLGTPEGRQRVLERMREFRTAFCNFHALSNRVIELAARVSADAKREGEVDSSRPGPFWRDSMRRASVGRYDETVSDFLARIEARFDSLDAQLAGVSQARFLRVGESLTLTNWDSRVLSGDPKFENVTNRDERGIQFASRGSGAWYATAWLDEGRYALTCRVRTDSLTPFAGYTSGAGFRVWSARKADSGFRWGWDNRRGGQRGGSRRGDAGTLARHDSPMIGTTNWTEARLEFDLRQPLADLDLCFEVTAGTGSAWFKPTTFKVTRLPDTTP